MECTEVRKAFREALHNTLRWYGSRRKERLIIALCFDHFERCPRCVAERDTGIAAIGGDEALERILLDPEKRKLLQTEAGREQLMAEASH